MAGYNGYSMSCNAVEAYDNYKMPLSRLKNFLGITDTSYGSREWHHTSKEYNITDFYDAKEAVTRGDIWAYSRKRPNPLQMYNRMAVMVAIIRDFSLKPKPATLARLEVLSDDADKYLAEKDAKRLAKLQAIKAEEERLEEERRLDYLGKLKSRCQDHKTTKERIVDAFGGREVGGNPSGMYNQIRCWFQNYNLNEALTCAYEGA